MNYKRIKPDGADDVDDEIRENGAELTRNLIEKKITQAPKPQKKPAKIKKRATDDGHTEDSLALSFCEAEPQLRYVAGWNRWLVWEETVWSHDDTLHVYDKIRGHVRVHASDQVELSKAGVIAAIERLAKSDRRYAATVDQWDTGDWVLNTPEGVVDLVNGKLMGCDPDFYLTKQTAVAPGGECPEWLRFIDSVTDGDTDYAAFLQRMAGYAATGSTKEHALFFLFGGGGNGKGTFLNALKTVLGKYATVAPMETFTDSKSDRHPTDLAMLRGARMVLAQETEEGRSWAESRIKSLTGGDPISARFMRQDFFVFEPKFKLLISGNHKPRLRNVDEAMRRRFHLLPFTKSFRGDKCDLDLAEKLASESGGILQWVLDGCLAYQREGLNPPKVVTAATAAYFSDQDIFRQWLDDCCELSPAKWDRPSTLFNSWKTYAERANEKAGSQKNFGERLNANGFTGGNSRAQNGRFYAGLWVIPEDFPTRVE